MRRDSVRLLDILQAAQAIQTFTNAVDKTEFFKQPIIQGAVIRELAVIGEAAHVISDDTKKRLPEIPWPLLVGMRNRLIHEYFRIDLHVVWQAVVIDIPMLIQILQTDIDNFAD
jgi:uncharacterized protein with HEPN domain